MPSTGGGALGAPAGATPATSTSSAVVTTQSAGAFVSLEASSIAIPERGRFGYTARVNLASPATSLRVRFQLRRPKGRLVFQRTRTFTGSAIASADAAFERDIADIDLAPGAYPVQVTVDVTRAGATSQMRLDTSLLVYDPKGAAPVVLVARVSGQPLSNADGVFVADPGRFTRARDDVSRLASWVLNRREARISLFVSPVLVEEWHTVADGYQFAGPEGVENVSSDAAVPRSYAAALELLRRAEATGRLELSAAGYADPDLSQLRAHGRIGDVAAQYARGAAAIARAVESTVSSGTVSAGYCVPAEAVGALAEQHVGYAIVADRCASVRGRTPAPGLYAVDRSAMRALVARSSLVGTLHSSDTSRVLGAAVERTALRSGGPLVVVGELGAGGGSVDAFTQIADALAAQSWVRLRLGREAAAAKPRGRVQLERRVEEDTSPLGYWDDVASAMQASRALFYALGRTSPVAKDAYDAALISECAAWAGPDGHWTLVDRGRAFADAATRLGSEVLGKVVLRVQTVTLSSSSGEVPVTLTNSGKDPVRLKLVLKPSGGLALSGRRQIEMKVLPRENYLEIPVDLHGAIQGELTVSAMAGDMTVARSRVVVRASYLDRIAIVAGILVLFGIVLAFIIRRVRAVEPASDADVGREKYTESNRDSQGRTR